MVTPPPKVLACRQMIFLAELPMHHCCYPTLSCLSLVDLLAAACQVIHCPLQASLHRRHLNRLVSGFVWVCSQGLNADFLAKTVVKRGRVAELAPIAEHAKYSSGHWNFKNWILSTGSPQRPQLNPTFLWLRQTFVQGILPRFATFSCHSCKVKSPHLLKWSRGS